jgi:type II secretory pathway component GspD/PulD (secretin)
VLIGGLIRDDRIENASGVPLLSDAPFIGRLFRSETRERVKSNMILMVRTKIVELE